MTNRNVLPPSVRRWAQSSPERARCLAGVLARFGDDRAGERDELLEALDHVLRQLWPDRRLTARPR